jgi:molybdenum cofactor cytidylyltransferase
MADARVAVVVLAAGASTRMGQPKLLLPLAGESLLRRVATRALATTATSVVVVVPPNASAWQDALAGLPVTVVEAPGLGGPVSGSLHAAIDQIGASIDAILVVLADMTGVTSAMMSAVIGAGGTAPCRMVGSCYDGVVAPPLLIPRRYLVELRGMTGDGVGRALFAAHADEADAVGWPASALHDIDTPEDYQAARPIEERE